MASGSSSRYVYIVVCVSAMVTCGVSQISIQSGDTNENRTTFTGLAYVTQFDNTKYTLAKFLGIAYARPPVGEKRFSKPEPVDHGNVMYDATQLKSICYQRVAPNDGCQKGNTMAEDCLYLNIYVPLPSINPSTVSSTVSPTVPPTVSPTVSSTVSPTVSSVNNDSLPTMLLPEVQNKFPVYVFIHGGAYVDGNGNCYDGSVLAGFGEIIVVTINYRLNVFGFVSTDDDIIPANLGLWDQHEAIKWVSENIYMFGGDPTRITVGGHSSGAYSAVFQGLFPGNDNLFHRVISQSGTPASPKGVFLKGYTTARNLATSLGCNITGVANTSTEIKSCLMKQDATRLAQGVVPPIVPFSLGIAPTIDGNFVAVDPFTILERPTERDPALKIPDGFRGKDLLIGFNAEDGEVILRLRAREKVLETNNMSFITELLGSPLSREAWKQLIFEILAESSDDCVDDVLIDAVLDKYMDWSAPDDLVVLSNRVVRMLTDVVFGIPAVNTALSHVLSSHNITLSVPGDGISTATNSTVTDSTATNSTATNSTATNTTATNTTATNTTATNTTASNTTATNTTAANSNATSGTGGTTFLYRFSLPTTNEQYIRKYISWLSGTEHSDEIPFVFGQVVSNGSVRIAKTVMKYWSNFVKTGNPNMAAANGPNSTNVYWKEFTASEQSYSELSASPESRSRVDAQSHHFWYDFMPGLERRLEPTVAVVTTPAVCVVTRDANSGSGLKVNLFITMTLGMGLLYIVISEN